MTTETIHTIYKATIGHGKKVHIANQFGTICGLGMPTARKGGNWSEPRKTSHEVTCKMCIEIAKIHGIEI